MIIPAFNEEATVEQLVARVRRVEVPTQIILIDDGSSDGTRAKLEQLAAEFEGVEALFHEVNRGKGAALRTGFQAATAPYVVVQDADLEYDPAEFPKLLAPLLDGRADVVFGSRFMGGECRRVLQFWHSIGNRLLTLFSNMATNLKLTDMETCYKVFKREVIQSIAIQEDRFGFEPEVTAKLARYRDRDGRPLRIYEIGISYSARTYEEGKKVGWRDGLRAIWCIVKYNFS